MSDLVTRLLAEIAKVEAAARAVQEGAWLWNDYIDAAGDAYMKAWANEDVALRMCQAHRKIVALCAQRVIDISPITLPPDAPRVLVPGGREPWGLPVLRALAEGYGLTTEEGV